MDVKRYFLLSLVLTMAAVGLAQQDPLAQVQARFREWNAALESVAVDFVAVPKGDDIQALAAYLVEYGYWEEPVLFDPWGNLYRFSSDGKHYSFTSLGPDGKPATADDLTAHGAVFEPLIPPEENPAKSAPSAFSAPTPRSPDTDLRLSKSGSNDILFSWTGAGTAYNITGAVDPRFLNAFLLSKDNAGPSYTYPNGLTNPKTLEFFSVTDNTGNEPNPAQDANGNLPPVPPSLSSVSGSWFIGGTPGITGTDFSTVSGDNLVCFPGGYCVHPTSSTATQLNLKVPPGAVSGPLTAGIGLLQSNTLSTDISLEDPALSAMIIRSLGFVPSMGDYYAAVSEAGTNKIMRLYYDAGTGKWARENRTGSYTLLHYGPPAAAANGNMYFGQVQQSTSGAGTRVVVTNPPTNAANCFTIPSPLPGVDSVRVVGIAADPNPEGIAGRYMFYALFEDVTASTRYIKQMYTDCSGIADGDWGNQSGSWNWNALNGAAVDPKTGDLYVAEKTAIRVVRFATETVETFKSGFATNIYNIAVWRDPGNDFGVLLVGDFGAANIKVVPLDNPSVSATVLASGSTTRAVCTGLTTYDEDTYQASDLVRLMVAHNDGSAIKLRKEPYFTTDPYANIPVNIWISSRLNTVDRPQYQGVVRYSTLNPPPTEYSTVRVKATWADGKNRTMCGALGDALTTAFYEPVSSPKPAGCKKPWKNPVGGTVNGACDNRDPFELSKVGSSMGNNDFVQCQSSCGGSGNPCWFEFRITQRYAGDNYRFLAYGDQSNVVLSSALITAWKRVFIEQDKMCRRGGVLWEDLVKEPDAMNGDSVIYLAKNPDNTNADNVQLGDIIRVFDTLTPYETSTDRFCVKGLFDDAANYRIAVTLADVLDVNCLLADSLTGDYDASVPEQSGINIGLWTFNIGKSAGVCVEGPGFFNADTSYLNRRNMPGAFDDGFTSFNVHPDGVGVVPYLPGQFLVAKEAFPNSGWENKYRFHQHWFKHRTYSPPQSTNYDNNYWHLMALSFSTVAGETAANSNASLTFVGTSEQNCWYTGSPPTSCTPAEMAEYCSHVAIHEIAHQDEVNICATGPHDSNNSWCGDTGGPCVPADARCGGVGWCVMNVPAGPRDQAICQRVNGIRRFDCNDLSGKRQVGSPYCQSPECACPTPPCTDPNLEKSIRSAPDPQ